jgi:hypothetical protein
MLDGIKQINKMNEKTYKEIHGTTRIGDFLRNINKTELIGRVIDSGKEVVKGDVLGAIEALIIGGDTGMTPEERAHALELVRLDIERERSISKRWYSDLKYGNMLTRTVRPAILIFLTVSYVVGWYLNYELTSITNLLTIVLSAYFGGRSMEKTFGKK